MSPKQIKVHIEDLKKQDAAIRLWFKQQQRKEARRDFGAAVLVLIGFLGFLILVFLYHPDARFRTPLKQIPNWSLPWWMAD